MSIAPSARIHTTAHISPQAEIGENVEVGAFSVLEGNVRIGPNCVIRPGAYILGDVTIGQGNQIFTGVVIGEKPQHLRYNDEPTNVVIGEGNIFREHVTVHRGTTASMTTCIGNHNFFMAGSHVAHDCVVGNRCILANSALMAGHCILEDGVFMSGNTAIQQFVRVGRFAMLSGSATSTKDVPPFVIQQSVNTIAGINVVALRRAGMSNPQINAIRRAYHILFRERRVMTTALECLEMELGEIDVIQELIGFIRKSPKGINGARSRFRTGEAA